MLVMMNLSVIFQSEISIIIDFSVMFPSKIYVIPDFMIRNLRNDGFF